MHIVTYAFVPGAPGVAVQEAGSLLLLAKWRDHFSSNEACGSPVSPLGSGRLFLKVEQEELVRLDPRQALCEKWEGVSPVERDDSGTV